MKKFQAYQNWMLLLMLTIMWLKNITILLRRKKKHGRNNRKCQLSPFSLFHNVFRSLLPQGCSYQEIPTINNPEPFPKWQILDSSKLKQCTDKNLKFYENGRKVLQTGRKHCGKRRNCSSQAISPFPTVFSKDLCCRHITRGPWWSYIAHLSTK